MWQTHRYPHHARKIGIEIYPLADFFQPKSRDSFQPKLSDMMKKQVSSLSLVTLVEK
jgi:hypothetical protein